MADEFFTQNPPPAAAQRRAGAGRSMTITALIAFAIGAGAVGYAAREGLGPFQRTNPVNLVSPMPGSGAETSLASPAEGIALATQQDTLEARMAALEQRFNALDLRAGAASGNAARAEALLIAFATRRALDRGTPLGYLEDQLRLRFGDARPNAVATVINAGRDPVTLDQLLAGLDALAPALTQTPTDVSTWTKVKRQFSSLFVIRHEATPSPAPQIVMGRARLLLESGKAEDAIAEVGRLPGAAAATDWITAVRRFDSARRALDVLETTAMLDTRGLKDSQGTKVSEPSPIVPTPEASAQPQ